MKISSRISLPRIEKTARSFKHDKRKIFAPFKLPFSELANDAGE